MRLLPRTLDLYPFYATQSANMIKGFPAAFSTRHAGTQPQRTHITHKSHYTRVHDAPRLRAAPDRRNRQRRALAAGRLCPNGYAAFSPNATGTAPNPLTCNRFITQDEYRHLSAFHQTSREDDRATRGGRSARGSPWFSVVLRGSPSSRKRVHRILPCCMHNHGLDHAGVPKLASAALCPLTAWRQRRDRYAP